MYSKLGCSFCGKPQGSVCNLVLTRKGRSAASICDECLEVCRKILVKSGTEPIVDAPQTDTSKTDLSKTDSSKTYYRVGAQPLEPRHLSCSFCGTSQAKAHRLIGSHPGLPPTYICDKCVSSGDLAIAGGSMASLGSWIARKLGKHTATIHDI